MRRLVAAAVGLAALALAGSAGASLQHDPRLDAVATDVAGFPLTVYGEDDPAAWGTETNGAFWGGFTRLSQPIVYLSPPIWAKLEAVETLGPAAVGPTAGTAVVVLVHEAEHQRLQSGDEILVNSCALQALPTVLRQSFGVAATVMRGRVVRIGHKRVRRLVSVANPLYVSLLRDARESVFDTPGFVPVPCVG